MIVLTMHVVQLQLQSTTFLNAKCQMYNENRAIMLNDLVNYCVPDLNTVLFSIPASDFHTNYRLIITVQKMHIG